VEDFAMAAEIIKGHKIPNTVRCLILPASNHIYSELVKQGYLQIFVDAGCIILNANCGPCGGMHEGLMFEGEACVGTHNRNFCGRMGSPEAKIYLASPATAAASALKGVITDPRTI
jgi:homoaconitase/3-isopropylmalate dehydratase large subunit